MSEKHQKAHLGYVNRKKNRIRNHINGNYKTVDKKIIEKVNKEKKKTY